MSKNNKINAKSDASDDANEIIVGEDNSVLNASELSKEQLSSLQDGTILKVVNGKITIVNLSSKKQEALSMLSEIDDSLSEITISDFENVLNLARGEKVLFKSFEEIKTSSIFWKTNSIVFEKKLPDGSTEISENYKFYGLDKPENWVTVVIKPHMSVDGTEFASSILEKISIPVKRFSGDGSYTLHQFAVPINVPMLLPKSVVSVIYKTNHCKLRDAYGGNNVFNAVVKASETIKGSGSSVYMDEQELGDFEEKYSEEMIKVGACGQILNSYNYEDKEVEQCYTRVNLFDVYWLYKTQDSVGNVRKIRTLINRAVFKKLLKDVIDWRG